MKYKQCIKGYENLLDTTIKQYLSNLDASDEEIFAEIFLDKYTDEEYCKLSEQKIDQFYDTPVGFGDIEFYAGIAIPIIIDLFINHIIPYLQKRRDKVRINIEANEMKNIKLNIQLKIKDKNETKKILAAINKAIMSIDY
jgi:hypothetical protein